MGEWVDIPLAVQAGEGRSAFVSDAELTNLMLQPNPPGSARPFSIVNTPALVSKISPPASGVGQGMILHGSRLWYVIANKVVHYNGAATTLGGSVAGTGSAIYRMVGAGSNEVVMVSGTTLGTGDAVRANLAGLTTITPPAGVFRDVTYMDGYTIYIRAGTDEFYISALDDPTTISALDFSTADALSDELVACIADHKELVLLGARHIEFWYNSGNAAFPFERISPGIAERGCAHQCTVQKWDNAIFFLGDDLRVYRLEGYRPTPISTPWIESMIPGGFDDSDPPSSCVFHLDGCSYYLLSFDPGDQPRSLVYNITTGLWHVVFHDGVSNDSVQYIGAAHLRISNSSNKIYALAGIGFGGTGAVYELSPSSYRDADAGTTDTTRTITCPAIEGDGARMFCHEVELVMEKVDGGTPGTVTYSYSDDGGANYTTHSAQSTNQDRVRWTRCGSFYRRINRFEFSTNARVAVSHARARLERGAS